MFRLEGILGLISGASEVLSRRGDSAQVHRQEDILLSPLWNKMQNFDGENQQDLSNKLLNSLSAMSSVDSRADTWKYLRTFWVNYFVG